MNSSDALELLLSSAGLDAFRLGDDLQRDYSFVNSLLSTGTVPLFEHSSFHVLGSLLFKDQVYALKGRFGSTVLSVSPEDLYLFAPVILDREAFSLLIKVLPKLFPPRVLTIRYLSRRWLNSNLHAIRHVRFSVRPRSTREAIYDVSRLLSLEGSHFRNLRTRRRKLLESGELQFKQLVPDTLEAGLSILERWQETQGQKYKKLRFEREVFILKQFSSIGQKLPIDSSFEIGYLRGTPLSIACLHRSEILPNCGTIYFVKGINRAEDGGTPGVSDATYCRVFARAAQFGITHLNDGDLGTEVGTRQHKLEFQPVFFLQSFDVVLGHESTE